MNFVSVVMSVFDEPEHVKKTIESVLSQKGVDFEFVIVSDGASEKVVSVVKSYQYDSRIRFIEQANKGLTVALINGCQQAKSSFIARIDAGDVMLEGRLKHQSDVLANEADVGFVASWVSIKTVEGYFLYDLKPTDQELNDAIRSLSSEEFRSPFHASVMFRKSVYHDVGGYRDAFYFAQDCDLWSRMIDCSRMKVIESVLTSGIFSAQGISGKYGLEQRKLLRLILKGRQQRLNGVVDDDVLTQAYQLRPSLIKRKAVNDNTSSHFDGLYFVAKVLSDNKSKYAFRYWKKVLQCRPISLKSCFFCVKSFFINLFNES